MLSLMGYQPTFSLKIDYFGNIYFFDKFNNEHNNLIVLMERKTYN